MTDKMTIATALDGAQRILAIAGIPNPRREARLLASHVLGITVERIMGYPEYSISQEHVANLDAAVSSRARREPFAHIVGKQEFWSLPFYVTQHTLVPRPDTESLVEAVIEWIDDPYSDVGILDLGTGTGCILLSLLAELTRAKGVGVDASVNALEVAWRNAKALGLASRVDFVRGDWTDGLDDRFDIVVSNPPYVADRDFVGLEPEVARFEPRLALSGGFDGLTAYRAIVPQLGRILTPGGAAFLEIGACAAADVTELIRHHGFECIEIKEDFSSIPRCVRIINTI